MKRILIDTNIVLDLALERKAFVEKAIDLLRYTAKNDITPCISATTVTDIYYVLRKQKGHDNAVGFLKKFFKFTDILAVSRNTVLNALYSEKNDFEDAVQMEAAKLNDIDTVITRNKKDFENSGLKIFSSEEYTEQMGKAE
jgi:predicted nucleic acid-binding protein